MSLSDHLVYKKKDVSDSAYVLTTGKIVFELNENDSFEFVGDNIIFGVPELLIAEEDGYCLRLFNARVDSNSQYKQINWDIILKQISSYHFGFNMAKYIAQTLIELDDILIRKKEFLADKEHLAHEYCKVFSWAVDRLEEQFKQKRYPWLNMLYSSNVNSISYAKGKAFSSLQSEDPNKKLGSFTMRQLDQFSQFYPSGAYVCQQGDAGDELYILKQGRLQVLINDYPIRVIENTGAIIGEMALLLERHRTASLKALDDSYLAVIKKDELEKTLAAQPRFLKIIAANLSRRILHHCLTINDLNQSFNNMGLNPDLNLKDKDELDDLRKAIRELYIKHSDMDWLDDINQGISEKLEKIEV